MNPTKKPKEKHLMQVLGNSLREGDIESGSGTPAAAKLAEGVFGELLETIRAKRREAYKRLMEHLDGVEERYPMSTFSLELLVLSGLTAVLACTLTLPNLKHHRFLKLEMWQWATVVLVIASGLSVVRFATFLLLWPVLRWWRIHKYVVFFTRQLKRSLDVMLWFCIILVGWCIWFRPRLKHHGHGVVGLHAQLSIVVVHQVTRFLITLCVGSFLWLLKNVLYLKLEADLHYQQFFQRLQQTVVYLHGVQILNRRGMWKFLTHNRSKKKLLSLLRRRPINTNEDKEEQMIKGVNLWMDVREMDNATAPIWILHRMEEEYMDQVRLQPLPGTTDNLREDKKILRQAKKLFKQLYPINKDLDLHLSDLEVKRKDLKEYDLSEQEVDVIFETSYKKEEEDEEDDEDDENIRKENSSRSPEDRIVGYYEFLNWAVRAYKNCWGLERTLCSSKRMFVKLNRLLSIFLLTIMLIMWLLISEIVNTGQLALLFTPFLAASFIFGDSCRKMFEGLIFAFAMHPFDVGDRVIINNEQMRVRELNILTTIFYKYDTGEEVITPNSTLTTMSIINLDITPDQSDKVEFVLNPLTPLEDIKDLEIKIKKLLDEDIHYSSNNKVVKSEIGKEEIKMTVYFKYLVSYLNAEVKAWHRSKILSMIMELQMDMKLNNKEYPPSYKPYILEINLDCKPKMKDLEVLQSGILRGLERDSKVVIMELAKSIIKMGLYVGKENDEEKKVEEKHETPHKMIVMEIKDVKNLYERLIEINKVIKTVKIFQYDINDDKYKEIFGCDSK